MDLYEQITEALIEELEKGVVPWRTPYGGAIGFPKNFFTGKEYQGVNVWLLTRKGYTSPYFLTYKQAQEMGGNVRKGERGSMIVKAGMQEKEDKETGEKKSRFFMKAHTVFNACQIEGIEFPEVKKSEPKEILDRCIAAQTIIDNMPCAPEIYHGTATAFYRPSTDSVHMPDIDEMTTPDAYYQTALHELIHSTGAAHRLNRRSLVENKGMHASRKTYAEEELVAEMGAAYLAAVAGIHDIENSAAYIEGWLKALKSPDAKGWIIRAASQAQKAANFILGKTV